MFFEAFQDEVVKIAKAYKLSRRMKFRDFDISIETDKGEKRHWTDQNGEKGTTTMTNPYGYIKRTKGVDGDHLDCYIGPHEDAEFVYVVHQMKKPNFSQFDEDKCMIGFRSAMDAKKAYLRHYNNPKFFGSMSKLPYERFAAKAFKSKDKPAKIAGYVRDRDRDKEEEKKPKKSFVRKAGPGIGALAGLAYSVAKKRPVLGSVGSGATVGWMPDISASLVEAIKD